MASVSHESLIETSGNITTEALRLAEERGVVRELVQLGEMTQELFPAGYRVEAELDPEIPNYWQLVVYVLASGSAEELARLNLLWHRRLTEAAPRWPGLFCLSIDIQG